MKEMENFPYGPTWYGFWEDFNDEYALTSNLPVAASSPWIGTALNSGTFAQTTDEKFGVAVISGAATTDNSGAQIQLDMETFSLTAGKALRSLGKFKLSESTQNEVLIGFCITDTTLLDGTGTLAAGLTFTDGVGFYKPDGETNLYGFIRRDSVQISTGAYSFDPTTYNVLSFEVQPSSGTAATANVSFFINGVSIGTLSTTTAPQESEEVLALSVAFLSGDALGTKTATLDYVGAAQLR